MREIKVSDETYELIKDQLKDEPEKWKKEIKEAKLMILSLLKGQDIQIYYQICGIINNIIYATKQQYHIEDEDEDEE